MSIDSIGNFLTIIRNGIRASKPHVSAPYSKIRQDIANILKDEGFVLNVVIENTDQVTEKSVKVFLKYVRGESVIHEIKRVSTPGRRSYKRVVNFSPVIGGLGLSIMTTNRGVITDKKA
ncbi:30S ribosomal protein S8, partial [bacterium]|nr:30S ribosomal protein S8 [bacterium]